MSHVEVNDWMLFLGFCIRLQSWTTILSRFALEMHGCRYLYPYLCSDYVLRVHAVEWFHSFHCIAVVSLFYRRLFSAPTGAPQNFTAIGISPTSIRLQWDPPAKRHQNGDIVLYEVFYHQQKQTTEDWTSNTTKTNMTVEGLAPVTDYNFQIRAYTLVGPGPWSNRLPFRPFAQRFNQAG